MLPYGPGWGTADDPIAIVKTAQVVCVETVAQIRAKFHGP